MKSFFQNYLDYPDQIYSFIDFSEFQDDKKNLYYVYGIFTAEIPEGYKNRIYYNVEEPNGLFHTGKLLSERVVAGRQLNHGWTQILQMCPYSTDWLRNVLGQTQYVQCNHFPLFDFKIIPDLANTPKIYDFMFQGSLHGYKKEFSKAIDIMTGYKHVWCTLQTDAPDPRKTHINVPYAEKIKLCAQTKMTILDNRLYEAYPGEYVQKVKSLPEWQKNEAFSHIEEGTLPQFKVKGLEHMITRGLCLVKRDHWDIMERLGFKDGEHFLYFDEFYELDSVVQECLSNWDACEVIIENAYQKVYSECSAKAFYERYLKPYDC